MTFLRLGLTSFGGPTAHLAYYRRELVERQGWIDEAGFAAIVAFCSILPGPTSSQVGMLLGLMRGGAAGAILAWIGFTLPSAVLMTAFALVLEALEAQGRSTSLSGALSGLTAAAAAVVAQAVLGLARSLCTERYTQTIALGATILAVAIGQAPGLQWLPIALGALVGGAFLPRLGAEGPTAIPLRVPRALAITSAVIVGALLITISLPIPVSATFAFIATIVRAGSLVFGGGHVVLPLLQSLIGDGLIGSREFFAGYGVVQAMPGPIFTFASFLGAANTSPLHGIPGALVATVAIFVPSFALVFAVAPVWNRLRANVGAEAALRGASASVVGLLGSVLVHPILDGLAGDTLRIAIAIAAYALIAIWRMPPWIVVIGSAGVGAIAGAVR